MGNHLGEKIEVSGSFFFFCIIILFVLPLSWVIAGITSAVFHEICHLLMIKLFHKEIYFVKIGVWGTEIASEPLSGWKEIICLLAGPAGSLFLVLFFRWLPLTAFLGLMQGLFNLLPVLPLDGGRIILSVFTGFLGQERALLWVRWIGVVIIAMLLALLTYVLLIQRKERLLAVALVLLMHRAMFRKIPCKLLQLGVQ